MKSETATDSSAYRAIRRPTVSCVRSFARAASVSTGRSAFRTIESRTSATHLTPVRRLTAAPIRCTEFGGEVVTTTSIPSARTTRTAAGIAVAFHVTFSSGTSTRRYVSSAIFVARSSAPAPCSSSAGLRPFGPT